MRGSEYKVTLTCPRFCEPFFTSSPKGPKMNEFAFYFYEVNHTGVYSAG